MCHKFFQGEETMRLYIPVSKAFFSSNWRKQVMKMGVTREHNHEVVYILRVSLFK